MAASSGRMLYLSKSKCTPRSTIFCGGGGGGIGGGGGGGGGGGAGGGGALRAHPIRAPKRPPATTPTGIAIGARSPMFWADTPAPIPPPMRAPTPAPIRQPRCCSGGIEQADATAIENKAAAQSPQNPLPLPAIDLPYPSPPLDERPHKTHQAMVVSVNARRSYGRIAPKLLPARTRENGPSPKPETAWLPPNQTAT